MWELDYKESGAPKNWCFWPVVLEKTLESPLDCKEIQPVHPKGDQSWVFIGGPDAEAETPILWPPDAKSWLIWKDPDTGKDWGREEKETTEDEMVGWHHQLDGHGFGWTPGVGDGQGGLACCGPWGRKELDTTERLNWTCVDVTYSNLMCLSFLLRKMERTIISPCTSLNALVVLGASDRTKAEILGTCTKAWKSRTPMRQAGSNHALLIPHMPLNLLCQLFLSCVKSQAGPQNFSNHWNYIVFSSFSK